MKRIILLAMLCLPVLTGFSQTAPATSEDDLLQIAYNGYTSGSHMITLLNKQPCDKEHVIQWGPGYSSDTAIMVSAGTRITMFLPGTFTPHATIKARAINRCEGTLDTYWREICAPAVMPLIFKSFTARKIRDNSIIQKQ